MVVSAFTAASLLPDGWDLPTRFEPTARSADFHRESRSAVGDSIRTRGVTHARKLLAVDEMIRVIRRVTLCAHRLRNLARHAGPDGGQRVLGARSMTDLALHVPQRLFRISDVISPRRTVGDHVAGDTNRLVVAVRGAQGLVGG